MAHFWLIAASTSVICYVATWGARFIAPKIGYLDAPDGGRKTHQRATPLLGGLAIGLSFALGVVAIMLTTTPFEFAENRRFVLGLLIGSFLYSCLGLWDDRWSIRARYKFLLQIGAAIPFVILGPAITKLNLLGLQLELGVLAVPFTVFWIVSCVNIVNLIDGMDGLATSIALIVAITLAILSFSLGQTGLAAIGLLFSASLVGFLFHNWPPAKIFLGDAGSLTIGFVIGALSTGSALKTATGFVLIFPAVLLAIPIVDTALAIVRRKLMGQGIGDGDRGHIHHRLQDRGFSKVRSLMVISGLCVAMALAVIVARYTKSDWLALVLGLTFLIVSIRIRVLGFHELNLASRSLRILMQVTRSALTGLRTKMSSMRLAADGPRNASLLWDLVESKSQAAGAFAVELVIEDSLTGDRNVLQRWSRGEETSGNGTSGVGSAAWDICYRVKRDEDTLLAFTARGACIDDQQQQDFESLAHLSTEICECWPVERAEILSIEDHFPASPDDSKQQVAIDRQAA
ncbi:MAG: MraY family glycosyltransferase [Pirellulaceae bacterium]|nr:MraY family glycosyltransferase [Pirellulaceae bacterium]